ncbi:MAG: Dabb family protein [Candidatus Pseudobacter hemicellulosilyticus]|uniref:Dabb family protein n=1 Tax=Candidatus Pseudobacter hemicellulosilyticus TaxID=3121375 RepID=A0AAJ5WUD9_9BACT|nr:MAG: Dabb family protein [Pseudobacter sp.]
MNDNSRRQFLANSGKLALASGAGVLAVPEPAAGIRNKFIHHVYFWLKEPDNAEHKARLVAGLKKLSAVKTIREFHIGQPANTNREVIDRSYAVSWLLVFSNAADQESYQTDPDHLRFIEECSALWSKVVVYDSVDVV